MATTDDIARRVEEADSARSARRTATAQLVGELARERGVVVQRLKDIERQMGDAITGNSDVIDVGELAAFTDVPAAELTQILDERKPLRGRRRRNAAEAPLSQAGRGQNTVSRSVAPEAVDKP